MRGIIEIEKWVTGNGDAFAIQFSDGGAQRTTKGRERQNRRKEKARRTRVRAVHSNPERILSCRCERLQYATATYPFSPRPPMERGASMPNSFPTAPDLDFPLAVRDINSIHQSHQRLGRLDFYYGICYMYVNAYISRASSMPTWRAVHSGK